MPLTIEDGSGVADANSFVTVAEATAYAAARGLSLPATDAEKEQLLVKAADYLLSVEDRFKGERVAADQALSWPRKDVYLYGSLEPLPDNQIPKALKNAQCQLAVDLVNNDLQPTDQGKEVQTETVGPLSTTYFRSGTSVAQPAKALALLEPLFHSTLGLRTFRA